MSTDRHGKTEDIIKDNIDNLRPNQYYLGAKREIYQPLMGTDLHGNTKYISLVQCRSVEFSGQSITTERCFSVGDISTTDEHGQARKNGDVINDNIDNLRPNQYPLGAKRSRLLTTDEHGWTRKHGNTETLRY